MKHNKTWKIFAIILIVVGITSIIATQSVRIKDDYVSKNIEAEFTINNESEKNDASVNNFDSENGSSMTIDWESLLKTNPDVVAWISIPGANISQPILKGKSNNEYLRHNLYKNYSHNGSIFISENTKNPFSQVNTVIYGHNLANGRMFSNLKKYKDIDFWENNQNVYIYFPDDTMKIYKIISFHTVKDADEHIYGTYYTNFKEFEPYINENNIYRDKNLNYDSENVNEVITLSTCTNRRHDDRYVIHAVLE